MDSDLGLCGGRNLKRGHCLVSEGGGEGRGRGGFGAIASPLFIPFSLPLTPTVGTRRRKLVGSLSNNDGDQFVKCWQIFLELNFKGLYRSSQKGKESRCLVFMSSIKREFRHFHVVVQ